MCVCVCVCVCVFHQVEPKDVEIMFNRQGRPAGFAFVSFVNQDVAHKAIEEKDGKHIGSRYLELSMAG